MSDAYAFFSPQLFIVFQEWWIRRLTKRLTKYGTYTWRDLAPDIWYKCKLLYTKHILTNRILLLRAFYRNTVPLWWVEWWKIWYLLLNNNYLVLYIYIYIYLNTYDSWAFFVEILYQNIYTTAKAKDCWHALITYFIFREIYSKLDFKDFLKSEIRCSWRRLIQDDLISNNLKSSIFLILKLRD